MNEKKTIIVGHPEKDCIICSRTDLLAFVVEAEWSLQIVEEGFISTAKDSFNALNSDNLLGGKCIG